jgi:hypothetical protein
VPTEVTAPASTSPSQSTDAFRGLTFVVDDLSLTLVDRPAWTNAPGEYAIRLRDERTNPGEPLEISGGLGTLASGETRTMYVGVGVVQLSAPSLSSSFGVGFQVPSLAQPAEFDHHLTITANGTNLTLPYRQLAVGAPVAHGNEASYDPTLPWTSMPVGTTMLRVNRPWGTTGAVVVGGQTFPLGPEGTTTLDIPVVPGHQVISLVVDGHTQRLALWGLETPL